MSTSTTASDPSIIRLDNGRVIKLGTTRSTKGDFHSIPVIDLSMMYSEKLQDRMNIAKQLFDACSNVGFFYAKNHGISQDVIDKTFAWSKKFFHEQSAEEKNKVSSSLLSKENYMGYHPFGETAFDSGKRKQPDLMEAFNLTYEREFDPTHPPPSEDCQTFPNIWPQNLQGFKEQMFEYHSECLKVARKLIRILALALGLEEHYFDKLVTYPAASMRIIHYPIQEKTEDEQNGIGAHTDFEIFTLVNTGEVSGLQVLNKSGEWIQAPPIPGCLVINIADCLMRMTNDTFISTVHRVVNDSGQVRYSIPFFFGFNQNTRLDPIPTCISDDNPPKYDVMTIKDYIEFRASAAKSRENGAY